MALIACPECGREKISDLAKVCPSCGFPMKECEEDLERRELMESIWLRAKTEAEESYCEELEELHQSVFDEQEPSYSKFVILVAVVFFCMGIGTVVKQTPTTIGGWVVVAGMIGISVLAILCGNSGKSSAVEQWLAGAEQFEKEKLERF